LFKELRTWFENQVCHLSIMSDATEHTVAILGEQGLLQRLQQYCPTEVIGDDAAIVTPPPGQVLVVTTDMLVDGVHFSDRTTTPSDIGWRTTAANLSDLAAMGAVPLAVTLSLGLPGELSVHWIEQLYQGMRDCLHAFGGTIVGGDVCRSPVTTLSMTALGTVSPHQQILRSTAQPGDVIVVTGAHGASRAGLELLLQPHWGSNLSAEEQAELCRTHQRPRPRLDVPPLLWQLFPKVRVAGMDSSDGLADAVVQICWASEVGAVVEGDRIPMPASLAKIQTLTREQALHWALYGGEDFELVLCLPPREGAALVSHLGERAAIVGQIVAGRDVILIESSQSHSPQRLTLTQGFQHFGPS
jgi:thiamine-monophosphate kinase